MFRPRFGCCSILLVALLFATGSPAFAQQPSMVWPKAPDTARIRLERIIASARDIEGEPGFLAKVAQWLFGGSNRRHWLIQPVGIAVSPDGVVYVADPGARGVHRIDVRGEEYGFTSEGDGASLVSPVGIAVAEDGAVYVSDSQRGTVTVYTATLSPRFEFNAGLTRPTGLAVVRGLLYVADAGAHRIAVFGLDGIPRASFGGRGTEAGSYNFPVALAGDTSLFIVDALNHRVQRCDRAGVPLGSIGSIGTSGGSFASPKSVALDSEGHVYVTDALLDAMQIFERDGALLLVVGTHGTGSGEFQAPSGVAIDAADRVYVVDSLNRRIQIFAYIKQAAR